MHSISNWLQLKLDYIRIPLLQIYHTCIILYNFSPQLFSKRTLLARTTRIQLTWWFPVGAIIIFTCLCLWALCESYTTPIYWRIAHYRQVYVGNKLLLYGWVRNLRPAYEFRVGQAQTQNPLFAHIWYTWRWHDERERGRPNARIRSRPILIYSQQGSAPKHPKHRLQNLPHYNNNNNQQANHEPHLYPPVPCRLYPFDILCILLLLENTHTEFTVCWTHSNHAKIKW